MSNETGNLDALIQGKLDADADFQAGLESLSEEEKEQAVAEKKSELVKQEFQALADKAKKHEELATNYKIRAEKAEKATPKKPEGEGTPKNPTNEPGSTTVLSFFDQKALIEAKIESKEDYDEVLNYATSHKISVADALKAPLIKIFLKEQEEKSRSAQVANTGPTKRSSTQISDEALLAKAETSELSDAEMDRFVEARFAARKANLKK